MKYIGGRAYKEYTNKGPISYTTTLPLVTLHHCIEHYISEFKIHQQAVSSSSISSQQAVDIATNVL